MDYNEIDLKGIREKVIRLGQSEMAEALGMPARTYQNYEINGIPVKKRPQIRKLIVDFAASQNILIDTRYLYIHGVNGKSEKKADRLSLKEKIDIIKKINDNEEEFYRLPQFKTLLENFSKDELYDKITREVSDIKDLLNQALNKTNS